MAKHAGGRPTELTPELTEAICKTLRLAGTVEDAARRAGIDDSTLYRWQARGKREKRGLYREFCEAIKKAKAERRRVLELQMLTFAKRNWLALAWYMERTDPEHYALQVNVKVGEQLAQAIARLKVEFANDPKGLERALAALAGESRGEGASSPAWEA
jgi:transposase-like protein